MEASISQLEKGQELNADEIQKTAELLLDLSVSDETKARLLLALSKKGETAAEIVGFVEAFLQYAVDPLLHSIELEGPSLDVCGTGGDQLDLFNVSTTAMFVAAGAGAVVVKHGNRGITSKSGGADVLEALGIRIDLPPEGFRQCIAKAGVGFLFAPNYHPAFKAVAGVRKQLAAAGHRSIFNLIGPLLNPVRPDFQLVGVFDRSLCPVFADILQRLGRKNAWVVSGLAPVQRVVDEVSLMGSTRICQSGSLHESFDNEIQPQDFGFQNAELAELQGGDAQANAAILEAILSGKETGPKRDIVLLNAAAALTCTGLANQMQDGIALALETIRSGAAMDRLQRLKQASR